MKKLTDRQREIYDFLKDFYHTHGFPPTIYEIGDHFGFTPRAAHAYLDVFQRKGFISCEQGRPRSIRFAKDYFSVKVSAACSESSFRVGDRLIACGVSRPFAGDGVLVKKDGTLRIEVFCGQKPILGKVVALCCEV